MCISQMSGNKNAKLEDFLPKRRSDEPATPEQIAKMLGAKVNGK